MSSAAQAHLWDCIPSKTMIATGGAMSFSRRIHGMGLEQQEAEVDIEALTTRIEGIKSRLQQGTTRLLESQGVQLLHGSARLLSDHEVEVVTAEGTRTLTADAGADLDGLASADPRLVHHRRRADPDDSRVLSADDLPGEHHGHRLRRHRRGVRPHVLQLRRPGDAGRQSAAGVAAEGSRGRLRCWRTTSSSAA
jgi:hypothetical protein